MRVHAPRPYRPHPPARAARAGRLLSHALGGDESYTADYVSDDSLATNHRYNSSLHCHPSGEPLHVVAVVQRTAVWLTALLYGEISGEKREEEKRSVYKKCTTLL